MHFSWRSEWPHWALLALLAAALAWTPAALVPVHWNLAGRADSFASKWVAMAVAVGTYALFLVLPRIDPIRANYPLFSGAYIVIRFAVLTMLVVLLGAGALGMRAAGLPHVLMGGLFVVTGAVLGKLRPNLFMGVRTPWTLASKRSWVKTHRLGGWLMIAWGLAEIVSGFVYPSGVLTIACAVLVAVVLTLYSFLVWRDDPDRQSALSSRPAE